MRYVLTALLAFLFSAGHANAETYYVRQTGSDSNSCSQARNESTAKRTINSGLRCLSGGDTLIIGNGSYAERIDEENNPGLVPSGSIGSPTVVRAQTTRGVILNPSGSGTILSLHDEHWVTIDGLVIDAINAGTYNRGVYVIANNFSSSTNIKLINLEVKNGKGCGMAVQGEFHQLINLSVHDNLDGGPCPADLGAHGLYLQGRNSLVEGGEYYNNGGYGIQQYNTFGGANNNVMRNFKAFNNESGGIIIGGGGSGNVAYNFVSHDNGNGTGSGTGAAIISSGNSIFNATLVGNREHGLRIYYGTGSSVRNILCTENRSACVAENNVGNNITHVLNTTVGYVNLPARDLELRDDSPAIDVGYTLSGFTTDLLGRARSNGPFDIGAYEYAGPIVPLVAPTNLRIVTSP